MIGKITQVHWQSSLLTCLIHLLPTWKTAHRFKICLLPGRGSGPEQRSVRHGSRASGAGGDLAKGEGVGASQKATRQNSTCADVLLQEAPRQSRHVGSYLLNVGTIF